MALVRHAWFWGVTIALAWAASFVLIFGGDQSLNCYQPVEDQLPPLKARDYWAAGIAMAACVTGVFGALRASTRRWLLAAAAIASAGIAFLALVASELHGINC